MFGINFSEFFVIAILALILIGPKQLPEVARTIGRFMNELKRGADVFTAELKAQVNEDTRRDSQFAKHDSERLEKEHQEIIQPSSATEKTDEKNS